MVSLEKNLYESPKISILEKIRTKTNFFKKIRTCTDKSIRVGTLMMSKMGSCLYMLSLGVIPLRPFLAKGKFGSGNLSNH